MVIDVEYIKNIMEQQVYYCIDDGELYDLGKFGIKFTMGKYNYGATVKLSLEVTTTIYLAYNFHEWYINTMKMKTRTLFLAYGDGYFRFSICNLEQCEFKGEFNGKPSNKNVKGEIILLGHYTYYCTLPEQTIVYDYKL